MQTQKNNKVGRPSKLTESRMEQLTEALRSGNYRIDACRAAGIHYNTLLAWEKKGASQKSGEYVEFLDALRSAEAEAVVSKVDIIHGAAMKGDWRASAWFLEHKYPDKWARLDKRVIEEEVIPDSNKDSTKQRVEEYFSELKRRGIARLENTDTLINALQSKGYEVFKKADLEGRISNSEYGR